MLFRVGKRQLGLHRRTGLTILEGGWRIILSKITQPFYIQMCLGAADPRPPPRTPVLGLAEVKRNFCICTILCRCIQEGLCPWIRERQRWQR